jgi:CBS domain-containing protein
MTDMNPGREKSDGRPGASPLKIEFLLPDARSRLVRIGDAAPLTQAAALFGQHRTDLIVVCDDTGKMVGVVSKTDIVSRIAQCRGHACTTMVAAVMTRDVAYCGPADTLQQAWNLMKERGVLHVPILDRQGRPLGMLYARDVLQALLDTLAQEGDLLRDYVMGLGYH